MLQQRAYDKDTEFDQIVLDAGTIASVADNGSGLCRITTTGNHGIHATQVSEGHKITVTGAAVETSLNTVHAVSAIIGVKVFDTDIAFPGTDTATFVVEKIYINSHNLLSQVLLQRNTFAVDLYIAGQRISVDDKHNANIVWIKIKDSTDDVSSGDSSLITGVKVSGNPAGTIKIVPSQAHRV